jgi:hypothetical protein
MSQVYDIDAAAGSYQPVTIKLRAQEYVLGETVQQLMTMSSLLNSVKDESGQVEVSAHIVEILATLAPQAPQNLTAGEQIALVRPITEVLTRFNALSFQEAA